MENKFNRRKYFTFTGISFSSLTIAGYLGEKEKTRDDIISWLASEGVAETVLRFWRFKLFIALETLETLTFDKLQSRYTWNYMMTFHLS